MHFISLKKYCNAVLLCAAFLFLLACNKTTKTFTTGIESIVPGEIYVVHSLSMLNDAHNMTSNIFLIKGLHDTIWIFGAGYGDGDNNCTDCNDYTFYKGKGFYPFADALFDAQKADTVITQYFKIQKDSAKLMFIAPHFHADHLNAEFIDALFTSLHYPLHSDFKIFIHTADSMGAVCNTPCCGTEPCPSKKNPFYASPYNPPWNENYLNRIHSIGSVEDSCGQVIKYLQTASGIWRVTKGMAVQDGGHTDGTINLENENLKLRIAGTINKPQCPLPETWQTITVHGDTKYVAAE